MKTWKLVIASGGLVAASIAPATAAVGWSLGLSYGGPGPYHGAWYGPGFYPRPYFAARYYYPRYYGVPVYGPPAYYAYPPPPRLPYPPPQPQPQQQRTAPRAEAAPAQKSPTPLAAIPPLRVEKMTLSATELFDFDKDTLREPQPKLDDMARALIENPSISTVTITGYTDRIGTEAYNEALSKRRAAAVKSYLMRQGVDGSRLNAIGRGEENPVVECNQGNEAELIKCLEPNRRVEIEPITVEKKSPANAVSGQANGRRTG